MDALKQLPFKDRLMLGLKFGILCAVLATISIWVTWNVWSYLQLKYSPHARALFAAEGERVAYLDKGLSWAAFERPDGTADWAGRERSLPRAWEGTLTNTEIVWGDWAGFSLRFTVADQNGSINTKLPPQGMDVLQPLERPSTIGRFNVATPVGIGAVIGVCASLILRVIQPQFRRAVAKRLARHEAGANRD